MAKKTVTTYKRTYSNGDVYNGPLVNDKPTPDGRLTLASGDVYVGEYDANESPFGNGKISYTNGDSYEGFVVDGKPHGSGTYTFADGDVYVGDFKKGLFHGYGKYYINNRIHYKGYWKKDYKSGEGRIFYENGRQLVGFFIKDKCYGYATLFYAEGSDYDKLEGYFFADKPVWGTEYRKDGMVYKGFFKNGMREGRGTVTFSDGYTIKGHFDDDKVVNSKKSTTVYPNGESYEGTYTEDGKFLHGKYTYSNGESYDGDWKDEKYHGYGTFRFKNGGKHVGEYANGVRHGQGTEYMPSGDKCVGTWKNDKRYGKHDYHWANGEVCYGGTYHADGTSSGAVTRTDGSTYYCRWDKNGKAIN